MLKIKLVPTGRKHQPHYRICIAEENSKLTGNVIEVVGHYHPLQNHQLVCSLDRVKYWVSRGASPTDRVRRLVWKNLSNS